MTSGGLKARDGGKPCPDGSGVVDLSAFPAKREHELHICFPFRIVKAGEPTWVKASKARHSIQLGSLPTTNSMVTEKL